MFKLNVCRTLYTIIFLLMVLSTQKIFAFESKPIQAKKFVLSWAEFSLLADKDKHEYIYSLRSNLVELEKTQTNKIGKKSYAFLDDILPKAWGAPIGVGSSCVYAGHLSRLVKSGARLVCERPNSGSCASGGDQIECNPVIFGQGVCVSPGSLATYSCNKNAKPIGDFIGNLSADDWVEIEAVNSYCENPLQFQKLICDKFYNDRLKALNKLKPKHKEKNPSEMSAAELKVYCSKIRQQCHPEESSNFRNLVDVQSILSMSSVVAAKESVAFSDCADEESFVSECIFNALFNGVTSAVWADEIYDLLTSLGLDIRALYDGIFNVGSHNMISNQNYNVANKVSKKPESQKEKKKQEMDLINSMTNKIIGDENAQRQISKVIARNIMDGIIQRREIIARRKSSEPISDEERCRKFNSKFINLSINTFFNDSMKSGCKDIATEACGAAGGLTGDAMGLLLAIYGTINSGGAASPLVVTKLGKIFKSTLNIARTTNNPSLVTGMFKLLGVSDEVLKMSKMESAMMGGARGLIDSIQQFSTDLALCKLGHDESRCKSVDRFTHCAGGFSAPSDNCLSTVFPNQ